MIITGAIRFGEKPKESVARWNFPVDLASISEWGLLSEENATLDAEKDARTAWDTTREILFSKAAQIERFLSLCESKKIPSEEGLFIAFTRYYYNADPDFVGELGEFPYPEERMRHHIIEVPASVLVANIGQDQPPKKIIESIDELYRLGDLLLCDDDLGGVQKHEHVEDLNEEELMSICYNEERKPFYIPICKVAE